MHVLFVDDNHVWQKIALKEFPKIGCTVAIAGDGQQALNYLSSSPAICPRPDIVLMDIAMPVMDGLEATRIIRTQVPFSTDPKLCSTPIVGLCITSLRVDRERFIAQGMDDIILKPWKTPQMQRVLQWWSQRLLLPRIEGKSFPRAPIAPAWGARTGQSYRGPRSRI
ncbi:CheY-like superfamily [Aspergillus karnatakaensis]|uniref:response regulator n=1 Tax=Aspergillus karnatakaensis TaxID=1810916 RepID=UPI003CCDB8B4